MSGELLLALLSAAVKAGLLLALAAGLVRLLQQASARARHGIWAGALAGALLVPALSPWLPGWSIAALPVPELAIDRGLLAGESPEPPPAARLAAAIEPQGVGVAAEETPAPAPRGAAGRARGAGTPVVPLAAPTPPVSRIGSTAVSWTTAARSRLAAVSPAVWLLCLWLAGCLASCAGLLR